MVKFGVMSRLVVVDLALFFITKIKNISQRLSMSTIYFYGVFSWERYVVFVKKIF